MSRLPALLAASLASFAIPIAAGAQDPSAPPIVRDVQVTGARDQSRDFVIDAADVRVGRPLPMPADRIDDLAAHVVDRYKREGYTFARVTAAFEASTGVLAFDIDEGVIDGVEFTGVDDRLKRTFEEEFALRAGDIFNHARARQAVDVLLRPTRGAIKPGRISLRGQTFTDTEQLTHRRGHFDLVDRDGRKILIVGLSAPAGRFKLVPDLGDREDWFSSVDGFVPSFGFGAAVFDHTEFNHAYIAGHLSYKTASERAGYALGFERPFFGERKLYVGGELRDLSSSDDQWQVSSLEASLAAIGPRRSFRDYYRRRGVQIGAAFRAHPQIELFGAWRGERHEPLGVASDFSFWNSDDAFRLNRPARDGRLNALILGASIDGRGFDRESLEATYRRHQLDTLYGEYLPDPERRHDTDAIWRVDWTSELSAPDAFGGDYDFNRHILSARYRTLFSPHQEFGARAIGGWSRGVLPPERLFAIGGIGSVHGYEFKERAGDSLALLNLEYALGWRRGLKAFGFFDAGRVGAPAPLLQPADAWLTGVGFGVGIADVVRVDFGYRLKEVPSSLRVTLRFGRSF